MSNALQVIRLSHQVTGATAELHELMERQVSHLIRLVDDLMEVSRISRGKIELRKQPVNLATIIQTAVESTQPRIDASGHQLAVSLPPDPIVLDADPVRISQVVANLLANAAKYMERGGQIDLVVRRVGDEAIISIRDRGLGIPAQLLPRVFEMFAQMDHTNHHKQGGLGIGLALAKQLVDMHGGRIEAHSAGLGKGSEFVVKLPVSLKRTGERQSETPTNGPAPLPQRKILVVDDTRAALLVLEKLLTVLGQHVRTAPDALTALEAARTDPPEIIISDIGMPEIDGYEFARRLRLEPTLKDVVLVALTGYGQINDRERGLAAGFDQYLVKPVSIDALRILIGSVAQRQDAAP